MLIFSNLYQSTPGNLATATVLIHVPTQNWFKSFTVFKIDQTSSSVKINSSLNSYLLWKIFWYFITKYRWLPLDNAQFDIKVVFYTDKYICHLWDCLAPIIKFENCLTLDPWEQWRSNLKTCEPHKTMIYTNVSQWPCFLVPGSTWP